MKNTPNRRDFNNDFQAFSAIKGAELRRIHPNLSPEEINQMVKKQWESTQSKKGKSPNEQMKQMSGAQGTARRLNKKLTYSNSKKKESPQNEVNQQVVPNSKQTTPQGKIKKIIKKGIRATEKSKFYQHYTSKLKAQHPRWTAAQVKDIIHLLWRKKQQTKMNQPFKPVRHITLKPLTGRKFFGDCKRKSFSMGALTIQQKWKRLPRESRIYWAQLGASRNGFCIPQRNLGGKVVVGDQKNSPSNNLKYEYPIMENPFNFMKSLIF